MTAREDVSFSADLDSFSINAPKNTSNKIRQIFDNISLNVISFLEKHNGVTDVKFTNESAVTQNEIDEWERKYYPHKLAKDYKSFLLISDGFLLKWHMKYNREVLPLGTMSLSPLRTLKPTPFQIGNINNISENEQKTPNIFAFNLDSNNVSDDGTVAMVFTNGSSDPSIWFQDLSCDWNFVCDSFSDYLRLMIAHLGLMNWCYAFTKVGLNPITLQWLRFLVPHRLDLDLRHNANGFGWIIPKKMNKNEKNSKLKRKKLNLNKIEQIVTMQLSKDKTHQAKIIKKLTLPNKSRPGSAPKNLGKKKRLSSRIRP